MKPEEAMNQVPNLLVVTYSLIRRREIAANYAKEYWGGRSGRWANTGWIKLLNRIILEEQVKDLPEPKPPLFYDIKESESGDQ